MSLSKKFNLDFNARKVNDAVLAISYEYNIYYYDFQTRVMTAVLRYSSNVGGMQVTPFSQLDRDTLIDMRDKLVELKGNPPELPADAPSNPGASHKLRP